MKKSFCDVCGEEIPKYAGAHFVLHLPVPEVARSSDTEKYVYGYDFCVKHGEQVHEFIQSLKGGAQKNEFSLGGKTRNQDKGCPNL